MPFNAQWIQKPHSVTTTVANVDINGRMRVAAKMRRPRFAIATFQGDQGSGQAMVSVIGISNISAVLQFNQPTSSGGGTQLMAAATSGSMYSGSTVRVTFLGDF